MQNTTAGIHTFWEYAKNLSPQVDSRETSHRLLATMAKSQCVHRTLAHYTGRTADPGVRGGSSSVGAGLPSMRSDGDRKCCNLKFHPCKVSAVSRHVPLNASLFTSTPSQMFTSFVVVLHLGNDLVKTLESPGEAVDACSPTHGQVLHPQEPHSDVPRFVQAIFPRKGFAEESTHTKNFLNL